MKERKKSEKYASKICRFENNPYLCTAIENKTIAKHVGNDWRDGRVETTGEMAEWSIAAVLKTVELRGSGGSNPSLSATNAENQQIAKQTPSFTPKNVKSVFLFYLR